MYDIMSLYDRLTSGHGIDYENQYTTTQQKVITFTPLATSILSLIGSVAICYIILSDHQHKLGKVKQRIILCMSILDIICSFWFALWGLPIPEGTPGVYGAHGSRQTCSAQGFFIQWQISVPMYNAALSVYYYLVVVKRKKDDEIAKHYEPWMHFLCNIYPFLTGIASFFIDGGLYNFDSIGCWIAPYPRGCKHNDDLTCIRGNHAYIFQWLFAGIEEASAALIIVYCMWYVCEKVRQAESVMKQYSFKKGSISDSQSLADKCRNTSYQALSYVAVVVATRFWSFVVVMIDEFGGSNPFWVVVLQQFWFPLQGFWNAIIYIQPYYKNVRIRNPDAPWYWIIKEAIQHAPTEDDIQQGRYNSNHSSNIIQSHDQSSSCKKLSSTGGRAGGSSIDLSITTMTTTKMDSSYMMQCSRDFFNKSYNCNSEDFKKPSSDLAMKSVSLKGSSPNKTTTAINIAPNGDPTTNTGYDLAVSKSIQEESYQETDPTDPTDSTYTVETADQDEDNQTVLAETSYSCSEWTIDGSTGGRNDIKEHVSVDIVPSEPILVSRDLCVTRTINEESSLETGPKCAIETIGADVENQTDLAF